MYVLIIMHLVGSSLNPIMLGFPTYNECVKMKNELRDDIGDKWCMNLNLGLQTVRMQTNE